MSGLLARLTGWAVRRPGAIVAAAAFMCLLGAAGALSLRSDASTDTLVDRGSDSFAATEEFKRQFGDDPVVVLVRGDLRRLVLTDNLGRLLNLEGCLAGRVPEGQQAVTETCAEIAELNPSQVVFGPATFLNQSAIQAEKLLGSQTQDALDRARAAGLAAARRAARSGASEQVQAEQARAAAQAVLGQFQSGLVDLAVRSGLSGPPTIDDPRFVSQVVCDSREPGCTPKEKFSYLFPSSESALISVRLRPDLSEEDRERAIELFRTAVSEDEFRLEKGSYVVSGVPAVVDGLGKELRSEIFILLAAAVAVMALVLALVFGPPLRLLPLAVALVSVAIAFGLLALVGGALTMASVAVLPVLIGLAVDYAIQFQARYREAESEGFAPPVAARRAAAGGGPVIATAGLATAAGFLVLLLSPVPMVRGFGVLLVLGIAIAFAVALTAGFSALVLARSGSGRRAPVPEGARDAARRLGTARAAVGARVRGWGKRTLAVAISMPGTVLAVAIVLAVGGWVAGTRTEVVSDITELVPSELPALQDVDELQDATGVSGELNVVVRAPDVRDPEVIEWMRDVKQDVLADHGFTGDAPRCEDADLCPAVALPDLFDEDRQLSPARVRTVLDAVPPYFSQAVLARGSDDGPPDTANMAFGIPVMPLDEQKQLIDDIRARIDPAASGGDRPPGLEAEVAGLPVLAAEANAALSGSRYWLTGAGLLAVAVALLAVYRSARRALVPLIPIVLAAGWSALVVAAIGIPLNPMSATLGALVIAIATEFSVLLSARYAEERGGGRTVGEALRRAYSRTGAAVAASGVTAIAGFAALIATEIRMLRDFGFVTVIDLAVALVGVLVVLPAALVWAEGGFQPLNKFRPRAPLPLARDSNNRS
ncbi:MAG TPA: MMPL family transporter [Solirubrobacterales bacterium]|nr:MMPL family transporter [Solirubrobacterales bacterium]